MELKRIGVWYFLGMMVITTLVSLFFLNPSPVSAYSMSINTSLDASVDITPSDDSSSNARITNDEVIIVTNCKAGYNLTLSSSVNDNNLYLDGDSSNNTSGTYFAPSNGSTALNNAPNTWGYYFSSYSRGQTPTIPTTTSVFSPVPALGSTPAVLKTTAQTASSTDINDTLYVYLGVAMDNGMAPGSYKMIPESNQNNAPDGSLTYYLTMDGGCRNYTVEYNANGGTGTMTDQDINAGEAVKLKANSFTAPALGQSYQDADGNTITADPDKLWTFWGWNTEVDGTGDWYKDRELVTDIANNDGSITLYAQWKQATLEDMTIPTTGTKTITNDTMQDMNGAICWNSDITTKAALQAANKTGATTLTDNRDGTTRSYDVSKLADGLCWMTTNLALGATSEVTLTSDDTDLADNTTFTLPAGDTTSYTANTSLAKIRLTNASGNADNGVYYTWSAAVANTTSTTTNPTTSICPKNWDLPTNNQYGNLSNAAAYSSTNPTTDLPSQFLSTGKFTDGATFYPTSSKYGFYWTSTSYSTAAAYGVRVASASFTRNATTGTTYGANKYYRKNIRCVANMDQASYTITYINTDTSAIQTKKIIIGQSGPIAPTTTWTRTSYRLVGWDTNSAATNVVYITTRSITPTGDMTLYTVWKPTYTINYNINTTDANAEGTMSQTHTNVAEGDNIMLYASNFSRANYGFAGWSFDQNAQPGGASRIYGPNETIEAPAATTSGEIKTLYAVWVPAETGVYMQTWNGCDSLNTGDVVALKDQRDTNTYAVAKLADDNCWMIENLRLESTNSDNSTGTLAQGYGASATYGNFTGLATVESANFTTTNPPVANSLYSTNSTTTNTIKGSNASYYYTRMPRYNNINTSSRASNPTSGNANIYSYGNYYTWAAAMANVKPYFSPTFTDDKGATSETVGTSICPTGWKLPYGNTTDKGATSGGFYYLGTQLGATTSNEASSKIWRGYPNNFTYSGNFSTSSASSRGNYGYYWSSTAKDSTYSYGFSLGNTTVGSGNSNSNKYGGSSIRCVVQGSAYTIVYDANNGTGAVDNQVINVGETIRLNKNFFVSPALGQSYQDADGTTITADPDKLWTFWGWNTEVDGSGDWYKDRESVTDIANDGETLTFYAQWKQATLEDMTTPTTGTKTIANDTMQDMDAKICWNSAITTAANAPATTLTDNRDGTVKSYDVSKLPDGNCWMTNNLALGTTSEVTLTSDDTDLADNTTFTLPAGDTTSYTATTRLAKIRLTNNSGTTANGTYYTWNAAVANTASSTPTTITTSICPKKWDLPTGAQYNNLSDKSSYSSSNPTTAAPSSFLIDGGYTDGDTFYQTDYSYFWTSTPANGSATSNQADGARINSTTMTISAYIGSDNKYQRKNIRCVASQGAATINYNANNGSGNTSNQTIEISTGKLAAANLFTAASNRQFKEWNTAANGTGTSYAAGASVSSNGFYPGQTLELYAIWDEVYYIAFNTNESSVGGTPGSATGTMTNQTVVRDKATTIKTNTFALTGYLFYGWNTAADGSGTTYSDGQKVTNLTTTGNTITLYAIWINGAYLDTGQNVNQKLKRLAGNSTASYGTQDNAITAIIRSNTLPDNFTPATNNTISLSSSPYPIYAWYNSADTTIYYYSEATTILMNATSSYLFYEMRALSNLSTISTWDTIKVTNMYQMFYYTGYSATTFTLDLSDWNTIKVMNMSQMFYYTGYSATTFTLDLTGWNTASVTSMYQMFYAAGRSATTWSIGDLSDWNTASVTDMSYMFYSAGYSATTFTLDLSDWNTANVIYMNNMFYSAGYSATTWSVTIPKTNDGTDAGPINNTTSRLYGKTTSTYTAPLSGKSFTLAN